MNNRPKMSGLNQLPNIDKIFKEDDDDFTPSVGSNLAAIFGTPQKSQESTRNSPARFTSTKQSAIEQNQSQTSSLTKKEVILAKAVHAFKLQNGQYVSIGKVGMALTGNAIAKQYDLILYKGTQNYISIVSVTPDFNYTVQANNYASYYDTNTDNWSILFENSESSIQLAREICLCKYLSRPVKLDNNIMYQDLNAVNKDAVAKEGDGITIKYLTIVDMTQPLKSENISEHTLVLEISKDDNWEKLLIGTSVGLKRMMILPSNKQIGLGPSFPKEREVIMEVEVSALFPKEEPPPSITKPPEVSQKATIISRMAKMGQSILPKLPPSTTTDSEDTEEEVFHKTTRHKRVESTEASLPKKHSHSNPSLDVLSQKRALNRGDVIPSTISIPQRPVIPTPAFMPQWAPNQIQQQYVTIDGQLLPLQQQTIAQPISTSMDPSLNVFLSETRTQNAELRMGLSKIGDNVQKILDKFHVLELQQASTPATDKSLETTLKLLMDINKNKQDHETKDHENQSIKNTDEAFRDQNLLETNKRLNLKLNALEKELKTVNELLTTKSELIVELNCQNDSLRQTNSELTTQIQKLEIEFSSSQDRLTELSSKFEQSKDMGNKYQEQNSKLENCVSELTVRCKEMEENMWKSETSDWVDKSKELKEIMAETFQELCNLFPEDQYTTDYIKSTIHRTLRSITFRIVSKETEKKKEKARKSQEESIKINLTETYKENEENENIGEELAESEVSEDIVNSLSNNSNNISGSQKEPPPLPKFDLDGTY